MDKYTVLPKPRHLVNPFRKMCEKYFIWSKYAEQPMLACQRDGAVTSSRRYYSYNFLLLEALRLIQPLRSSLWI